MEIAVRSLKVQKRPVHLDPYKSGNAPTTAIPLGNMPTLKLKSISKKHSSSMGGADIMKYTHCFWILVARRACREDL